MVAVVVMVLDVEVKSGEGEGDTAELKQASSAPPGLFSSGIMANRSSPEDATLELLSEGAKGSLGDGRGMEGMQHVERKDSVRLNGTRKR